MAMEILIPNSAIRNLIREDKVHQIYGMMQAGQAKHGMQTMNQSLAALYFKRMITLEVALARSSYPDELQEIVNRGPASLNPNLTAYHVVTQSVTHRKRRSKEPEDAQLHMER